MPGSREGLGFSPWGQQHSLSAALQVLVLIYLLGSILGLVHCSDFSLIISVSGKMSDLIS